MTVRLLVGDARERLRKLPDACVDVCVTSPPYWGLRQYSTEPQIWGGAADCDHDWCDVVLRDRHSDDGTSGNLEGTCNNQAQTRGDRHSATCARCGAWRGELGAQPTPDAYITALVEVFREVRRVLKPMATCWIVIGDSYSVSPVGRFNGGSDILRGRNLTGHATSGGIDKSKLPGLKPKDLIGIPWLVAFALRADGWWLRSAITWAKTSAMPESVTDRPSSATEMIFLLSKRANYYYDYFAVRQPAAESTISRAEHGYLVGGKSSAPERHDPERFQKPFSDYANGANLRNFWLLGPSPSALPHFAQFPPEIPRRCIAAGTSERGCCPACGAPYRRVVQRTANNEGYPNGPGGKKTYINPDRNESRQPGNLATVARYEVQTLDWQPTCTCNAGSPVPAVVLDPFAGVCTTGLVCTRLGRDFIGIELNPDYVEIGKARIEAEAPLFNRVDVVHDAYGTTDTAQPDLMGDWLALHREMTETG